MASIDLACNQGRHVQRMTVEELINHLFERVHGGTGNIDPVSIDLRKFDYNADEQQDLLYNKPLSCIHTEGNNDKIGDLVEFFLPTGLVFSIDTQHWVLSIVRARHQKDQYIVEAFCKHSSETDSVFLRKYDAVREYFNTLYMLMEKPYTKYQELSDIYEQLYTVQQLSSGEIANRLETVLENLNDVTILVGETE